LFSNLLTHWDILESLLALELDFESSFWESGSSTVGRPTPEIATQANSSFLID
jgi:hypothetical protein